MDIEIRHNRKYERHKVDVMLYNRGTELGIDFNNNKSQIKFHKVTASAARAMIRELEAYLAGTPYKPANP